MASARIVNVDIDTVPRDAQHIQNELSPYLRNHLARSLEFTDDMMKVFLGLGAKGQSEQLVDALRKYDKEHGKKVPSKSTEEKKIQQAVEEVTKKRRRGRPKKASKDALQTLEEAATSEKVVPASPAVPAKEASAAVVGTVLPPSPPAAPTQSDVHALSKEDLRHLAAKLHGSIAEQMALLNTVERILFEIK